MGRIALPWAGFHTLRPGRIHVFCPRCHRKLSNVERGKYDPCRAVLVHTFCDRCGAGGKDCAETFFAANGREIPWAEIEREMDRLILARAGAGQEENKP